MQWQKKTYGMCINCGHQLWISICHHPWKSQLPQSLLKMVTMTLNRQTNRPIYGQTEGFLHSHSQGEDLLQQTVINDETRVHRHEPSTKWQSTEWEQPSSPKIKNFISQASAGKMMLFLFCDCNELIRNITLSKALLLQLHHTLKYWNQGWSSWFATGSEVCCHSGIFSSTREHIPILWHLPPKHSSSWNLNFSYTTHTVWT